jgi:hypothetical protein
MKQPVKQFLWWMTFMLATFSLSKVFEASRALTGETSQGNIWVLLAWGLVLVLSFLFLVYDSYAKSRDEGKVARPVWFLEKLYQCQHREGKDS